MSAHQMLAPMILASLLVAAAAFAFNETVVVRATRTAEAWTGADYKPIPPDSGVLSNVWAREGEQLIHADLVVGRGADVAARGRDDLPARGRDDRGHDRRAASRGSGPAAGGCSTRASTTRA